MNVLFNVVAFKIGWLSSVLGAANGMPLLGPAVVLAVVALHLFCVTDRAGELLLVLLTGAVGAAWDSFMVSAGWLSYPTGNVVAGLAPYWIVAMWMLFATTLNVAFRWLRSRLLLASVMGAVFGPLSYFAGAKAGAVVIHDYGAAMTALALAWAVLMPALLLLARRLDGAAVAARERRA